MTALEAYILARTYTRQAIEGAGALKGAPCQIQSIEAITGGNRITFAWETGDGEIETDTLDVMDGADGDDGVGIVSITYKETDAQGNNVYTVTLTSGSTYDITCPKGAQGETGATGATGNGIVSIEKTSTEGLVDTYTITYTNGSTSTFTVTNGATPTVDSEMSESSENPLQNKVITAWTSASTKSVTGNPITISDAAAVKAKALSVTIEPVQDLHGQSAPYVGGAGKNKLPLVLADIKTLNSAGTWSGNAYTVDNVTFTILVDNADNVTGISINASSPASADIRFDLCEASNNSDCILNGCPSGGSQNSYCMTYYGVATDSGSGAEIPANSSGIVYIRIASGYTPNNVVFYPMIRLSTETDATFAPYTNICPISGHTEASVQRDGVNIFLGNNTSNPQYVGDYYVNSSNYNYVKSANAEHNCFQVEVFSSDTYRFVRETELSNIGHIRFLDKNKEFIRGTSITTSATYGIIETPSNCKYIEFSIPKTTQYSISINYPSTDETFYNEGHRKTYTIALGDTIYGGTVDFDSGVMTVTHNVIGASNFSSVGSVSAGGLYPASANIVRKQASTAISNMAKSKTAESAVISTTPCFYAQSHKVTFYTEKADIASFKTAYADLQFCYELATPFTVQLTPQQIQLLKGTNTLTANGATISLTYQPDNLVGEVMEQVDEKIAAISAQFETIYYDDGTKMQSGENTFENLGNISDWDIIIVYLRGNYETDTFCKTIFPKNTPTTKYEMSEFAIEANHSNVYCVTAILEYVEENKLNIIYNYNNYAFQWGIIGIYGYKFST